MLALRARPVVTRSRASLFSSFLRHQSSSSSTPPKPIEDSTSALRYKYTQRKRRPSPLPATDIPRSRTAEEAVTNILYNTPPPSTQPFKKHVLNCLVQNEPGVLSRVSGCLAARGFNIDSLVVCRTEIRDLSRMCIVLSGQDGVVEQARRQLEDLVPVWAVLDYTETPTISRELLLAKISILGPEYLEEQLAGGPTHEPRRSDPDSDLESEPSSNLLYKEVAMAQTFERSGTATSTSNIGAYQPPDPTAPPPLTLSEVLRLKHQHLSAIKTLSDQFGARIVDVADNSVIVEMAGKSSRVEAFLGLLKPFGLLESTRTGVMVMPRTPIASLAEDEDVTSEGAAVDASLLPPG